MTDDDKNNMTTYYEVEIDQTTGAFKGLPADL